MFLTSAKMLELTNKPCSNSNYPLLMRIYETDLNSNFEGYFSDGVQRGVQSALSQMLLSNHVRNGLKRNQNLHFSFHTVNKLIVKVFCIEALIHVKYCKLLTLRVHLPLL